LEYQTIVLSHTLEHIYDTHAMLEQIKAHLAEDGMVVVEVPIWMPETGIAYDHFWQHCNKYTPYHLEKMFTNHCFKTVESYALPDYRTFHCWRLTARRK
jgi:2-polyprenyl-3-methyl-5-hydroxy-6-metoxy-1,4-benzoquinol methylase